MQNFRNLQVWSKSHKFTLDAYQVSRRFPADERFGLTSQIRRACASIGANIAEGAVAKAKLNWACFFRLLSAPRANCNTSSCSPVTCHTCRGEITNVLPQRSPE
jgi:23S rRNA-intervening sequence protein